MKEGRKAPTNTWSTSKQAELASEDASLNTQCTGLGVLCASDNSSQHFHAHCSVTLRQMQKQFMWCPTMALDLVLLVAHQPQISVLQALVLACIAICTCQRATVFCCSEVLLVPPCCYQAQRAGSTAIRSVHGPTYVYGVPDLPQEACAACGAGGPEDP